MLLPEYALASTELLPAPGVIYTDVPLGSPFYTYIQCLACRGIISGYSDGTYRPGGNVTRGQVSKIVASAAGLGGTPAGQTFEDVPPTQPFYLWVERLAAAGAISGYGCSGPGEPCVPPGNRPYFRPGGGLTRGQLAKIDAQAAGYADPVPTTQQTFADVPPGQPFWLWIERVAARTIISGYACGGPGEPCDPAQRPYFRPGAGVTRGQTAKVVSNTFFPNCQIR